MAARTYLGHEPPEDLKEAWLRYQNGGASGDISEADMRSLDEWRSEVEEEVAQDLYQEPVDAWNSPAHEREAEIRRVIVRALEVMAQPKPDIVLAGNHLYHAYERAMAHRHMLKVEER